MIRDAEYLAWAIGKVEARRADSKEYLQSARGACTLLATSGTAQTIAFLAGKGGVQKHVVDDLQSAPEIQGLNMFALDGVSTRDYIRITRCVRRALVFLKRAAEMAKAALPPANEQEGVDAD